MYIKLLCRQKQTISNVKRQWGRALGVGGGGGKGWALEVEGGKIGHIESEEKFQRGSC